MYFHVRDLPHFRDHLNDYLGPPAPSCRKGVHRDPGSAMEEPRQSINTLQGDPAVQASLPEIVCTRCRSGLGSSDGGVVDIAAFTLGHIAGP